MVYKIVLSDVLAIEFMQLFYVDFMPNYPTCNGKG